MIPFLSLLRVSLKDRVSLGWAVAFPVLLFAGLALTFKDPTYRAQMLPGVVVMAGVFFTLHGTAFEVLAQRRSGVYKLLRATPYRVTRFVAVLALTRSLLALGCALLVLLTCALLFGVSLTLSATLLLVVPLALGLLCFTLFGFVVGNVSNTEGEVAAYNNLGTFPVLLTTGAFFSLERAPEWLQVLSNLLPFRYFFQAVQAALRGDGVALLLPLAVLAGFTLLALVLAAVTFRWETGVPLRLHLRQT